MTPNIIQFQCASCGTLLTVPVQMAGVTGPCPHCQAVITSPAAPIVLQPVPAPFASPLPAAPEPAPVPAYQPPVAPSSPVLSPAGTQLPPRREPNAGAPAWPPQAQPVENHGYQPTAQPAPQPIVQPVSPVLQPIPEGIMGGAWPPNSPSASQHPLLNTLLSPAATEPPTAAPVLSQQPAQQQPAASPFPVRQSVQSVGQRPSQPQRPSKMPTDHQRKRGVFMLAALLMACLTAAGIGWFFKDQIKAKWLEKMAAAEVEPAARNADVPRPVANTQPKATAVPEPTPQGVLPKEIAPKAVSATTINPPPAPFDPNAQPPKAAIVEQPTNLLNPPPAAPVAPPAEVSRAVTPGGAPPPPLLQRTTPPVEGKGIVEVSSGTASLVPQPFDPSKIVVEPSNPESEIAVETLKKFFGAKTWEERIQFVQLPDEVRPTMQQYYASNPDGPIAINHIQLIRHDQKPQSGPPHCVFEVAGPALEQPLPIMVEQTPKGYKVDWLSFTEFKDKLLLKFGQTYQEQPARFHVMVRRTHYFDDDVPQMDKKQCFELTPPMPGFTVNVFAEKGTPLAQELDRNLGWEVANAAVIVELRWKKQDTYQWIELSAVPQYNWRNAVGKESSLKPAPAAMAKKSS